MTAADAPDALRRLVVLVNRLLHADTQPHAPGPSRALTSRLQRVARLRDELHVTANRVARFGVEEHPILEPVRIGAPITSNAVLAAARLLYQLESTAQRLVALLDGLSADDWVRTGRMEDRLVSLGELVERVLHRGTHDVSDLMHAESAGASEEVAAATGDRSRLDRRALPRPRFSSVRRVDRDAEAS